MSEYIVDIPESYPFKIVQDGWHYHVECEYQQREEIVRCRDCKHYVRDTEPIDPGWPMMCEDTGRDMVEPDGFCAWGTKTDFVTCKCGEDIERIGRIQTCPSCGRKVMA